jgi:hypothetical protein
MNDGTPEPAARRCGEEIAHLRVSRIWSRAKLIARLFNQIDPNDPNYDSISEAWLARLENGRMVKVPRKMIEAICRALGCTAQERVHVLLYADRNVFSRDDTAPDTVAEALTYTMDRLYVEAWEMLANLIGQRRAQDLDEHELFELTATALELVIKRHRQQ